MVALFALMSLLVACSGADATIATIATDTAVELAEERDDVVVIDVRTPEEYEAGHVEGAVLLDLSGGVFEERIGDYDRDTTYVLYCRTGNRSAQAAAIMGELGFTDVRDAGAYEDLAAAGAAVSSD